MPTGHAVAQLRDASPATCTGGGEGTGFAGTCPPGKADSPAGVPEAPPQYEPRVDLFQDDKEPPEQQQATGTDVNGAAPSNTEERQQDVS